MSEKLTPEQNAAVVNRGGKLLVSAAAGSGKTKVLVDRLLGYLTDKNAPANLDDFLMITYTKAAASELRAKIGSKLSERIAMDPENRHLQRQIQRLYLAKISTVHGFCADLLREYAYRLDLPADFRVADENECAELRQIAVEDVLNGAYNVAVENTNFFEFVDTQGLGRDDRQIPEIIQKVYDAARCHLNPRQWLEACIQNGNVSKADDAGKTVWGQYLMDDLTEYLHRQLEIMQICVQEISDNPELSKPAAVLNDTIEQMRSLENSQTWNEIVNHSSINYGRLTFPRKYSDSETVERIKAIRNACKKGLEKRLRSFADPSEQVLSDLTHANRAVCGMIELVQKFSEEYSGLKQRRKLLDFGDLEHKTLDLLLGLDRSCITDIGKEIGNRYREVMIDEYQDSNTVQNAIFMALTEDRQNCFMVGDVKQSIYQFRLADPEIFLEKYDSFLSAENAGPGQGRKINLSCNFRSGGAVLEAANDVFRDCMSQAVGGLNYGDSEALKEGIPHQPLGEPEIEFYALEVREDTYHEDASFVAERVQSLLDGTHMIRQDDVLRPIAPEDIAILLRSPGSVGESYQQELEAHGIRCSSGGGTNLLETAEISALYALLQTISNPRQDIPLLAVLAGPLFGFTSDDLAVFRSMDKKSCIYDALLKWNTPKANHCLNIIKSLHYASRRKTLAQLLENIYSMTDIEAIYGAMDGGNARLANLRLFYQMVIQFEAGGYRDLQQLLEYLQSMKDKGLIAAGDQSAAGSVTLMSIHKSKGLEFPVVILCGLSREFNRESQRAQILCDKKLGIGLSAVDQKNRIRYPTIAKRAIAIKSMKESLSEEMRVLYVAMTRAKDRLIMTYPSRTLEAELRDIALRLDFGKQELLTADVVSPGEWILQSVMRRAEAGPLFALGGRPQNVRVSDYPWKIQIISETPREIPAASTENCEQKPLPAEILERMRQSLSFQYGYIDATLAPSKQTATQRKGRQKDAEIAEHAQEECKALRTWRKPSFIEKSVQGTTYGTAMHTALQFINFQACTDLESVRQELKRLKNAGLLTDEQLHIIVPEKIMAFFDTDVGTKLRGSKNVLREFKFSILDDAADYVPGLNEEQILLQGVVDCALLEPDGITVIDFKTDHVTKETVSDLVKRYQPQVTAYAHALSKIFHLKIKQKLLYFFGLNQFLDLEDKTGSF